MSNWELLPTPSYKAFKRGFRDGFEGRTRATDVDAEVSADYESGFGHGSREGKRLPCG